MKTRPHQAAPAPTAIAQAIATALAAQCLPAQAQTVVTTERIEVVGTTPLSGVGVPRLHLPANVQSLDAQRMEDAESLHVADQLLRQVPAVTVNEIQGIPFQMDLNYRGFTASPLLAPVGEGTLMACCVVFGRHSSTMTTTTTVAAAICSGFFFRKERSFSFTLPSSSMKEFT